MYRLAFDPKGKAETFNCKNYYIQIEHSGKYRDPKPPEIWHSCSQILQNFSTMGSGGQNPRVSSFVEAKLAILNKHQSSASIVHTLWKYDINQPRDSQE